MGNEDLFIRVDAVVQPIIGREGHNHPPEVITQLFNLYNEVFNAREYSKACSGCRARVWKGLKAWWEAEKQKRV